MSSFADRVIRFNDTLQFRGRLPEGIRIMNPFREDKQVKKISEAFYRKYYDDNNPRHLILGINPGRFGGGLTGIPFTDPKRLTEICGIVYRGPMAHEPSSAFIYEMIEAFGGPKAFYSRIYINSICPLGFTAARPGGKEVNYNYYDSPGLTASVTGFIDQNIREQIRLGVYTDTVCCFGTGKNEKFLRKLNDQKAYFRNIVALEHPRFIMQYKSKEKQRYIDKYLQVLRHDVQKK